MVYKVLWHTTQGIPCLSEPSAVTATHAGSQSAAAAAPWAVACVADKCWCAVCAAPALLLLQPTKQLLGPGRFVGAPGPATLVRNQVATSQQTCSRAMDTRGLLTCYCSGFLCQVACL